MSLLVEIFYSFSIFFILYALYELLDYKHTKNLLDMIKESIRNDIPLSTNYGFKFLIDMLVFFWTLISILISAFNGLWVVLYFSIGIVLMGIIQLAITINLSNRNKNIVIPYYITTIIIVGMLLTILIFINPLDLL